MSNQNEFEYIEAKEFLNLPVIEISDVKSFVRFANAGSVKYIFKITKDGKNEFFFPQEGVVYKIEGEGYLTLADMQKAVNGKFPTAKEYYEAESKGHTSYQEYIHLSSTGDETKEEYDAAKKAGFDAGFAEFLLKYEEYKKNPNTSLIPDNINNSVKLHKYALSKGIEMYDEFKKIYNPGFPDDLAYNDATKRGFKEGASYFNARKRGFTEEPEYAEAMKLEIDSMVDYEKYKHLKDLNAHRGYPYDKLQLLVALSNCNNGDVISIAEAKKLLQNAQEKFKKPSASDGHRILPIWYNRSIDQEDKLVEFLKTNEELKKFGFFNTSKNSFEIFKASAVKIYVDGSNVAHNGNKKPDLKNIRLVIKELNFWKFKNVVVLVDASLKHKLKHPAVLEAMKKEFNFHEVPSKTAADEFLIASIKKEKCYIVSNDTFKDWQAIDKWVSDMLPRIRVPFTISNDDMVTLKGMEELREKVIEE